MTEKEFLELNSRERDVLVAKHVIGCNVKYKTNNNLGLFSYKNIPKCNCEDTPHSKVVLGDICRYTTSWEAMQQVVEQIIKDKEDDYYFSMHRTSEFIDPTLWACSFGTIKTEQYIDCNGDPAESGGEYYEGNHKSLPLAVAIAALKGKGIIK
jgi:hypothetical protein